ncbi:MAG: FAD-dependent oxidoreductase [Gaiellaceae bacterium]
MTAAARTPLVVVADDDPDARALIEEELGRRYGDDYAIRICATAELAQVLDEAESDGTAVAVALAAGQEGAQLLAQMRGRFPTARRGLLIPWLGWTRHDVRELVLRSMAHGWIDLYVIQPTRRRDEVFHRTVSELLQESERLRGEGPSGATVVADAGSSRGHDLRATLAGLGIPHRLLPAEDGEAPAVRLASGQVLTDPDAAELTRALGFPTELDPHEADLLVVGAGPAGLSTAVYGASEGLRTTVLDAGAVGGQAGSSSLIRNYLGFPRGLGGGELAQRAYQQAWLFGAQFRLTHRAVALEPREGQHVVTSNDGTEIVARTVVLALGVEYRRLDAPGLRELEGAGVFYGASMSEAQALAGETVYIVGGGNSSGQTALHLARYACKVKILVRSSSLAASMSQYLIDSIDAARDVEVLYCTEVVGALGAGRLEALELRTEEGTRTAHAAALIVLIGANPHTEWLPDEIARDEWGYVLTGPGVPGWPLERPPFALETSVPGVFAAGDVRARAVKRVAAAAGSGALAVSDVHSYLAQVPAQWPARS